MVRPRSKKLERKARQLEEAATGKAGIQPPSLEQTRERGIQVKEKAKAEIEKGVPQPEPQTLAGQVQQQAKQIAASGIQRASKIAGRLSNVADVLSIAVNPFSKDKIVATSENKVFNTAAEYIANSPFTAASMIGLRGFTRAVPAVGRAVATTRVTRMGAVRGSEFVIGKAARPLAKFSINTKSAKQSVTTISKVLAAMKKPSFILPATAGIIGTYPWAEWSLGEAKEGMIFNTKKALETGDPQVIAEFQARANEIYDINMYENLARLIPGANLAFGFSQKAKALNEQWKVNNALMGDRFQQQRTGQSEQDFWQQNVIREKQQEEEIRNHFVAETRRLTLAGDQARAVEAAKEAAFWDRELRKLRFREDDQLNRLHRFWRNYRRTAHDMEKLDNGILFDFI